MKRRTPSYCLHKASRQAVVRLSGQDIYLGPYDSPESRKRYAQVIAQWIEGGRTAVAARKPTSLCIAELFEAFDAWAEGHYPVHHNGGERRNFEHALRPMVELYADIDVDAFGTKELRAVRQKMIDAGLLRKTINVRIGRIRRFFRWAVGRDLAQPATLHRLEAVESLRCGQPGLLEAEPVAAVPREVVERTLPVLEPVVADLVMVQLLAGMRPGEVVRMREDEIDRTGEVWLYRPDKHKNQWRGRERIIPLGPQAQAIISPRLANGGWVFPGRRGKPYTTASYYRHIYQRCQDHGIPVWGPLRVRHLSATEIRRACGLEAAQAILGHSRIETTQIYAERLMAAAAAVAAKSG